MEAFDAFDPCIENVSGSAIDRKFATLKSISIPVHSNFNWKSSALFAETDLKQGKCRPLSEKSTDFSWESFFDSRRRCFSVPTNHIALRTRTCGRRRRPSDRTSTRLNSSH